MIGNTADSWRVFECAFDPRRHHTGHKASPYQRQPTPEKKCTTCFSKWTALVPWVALKTRHGRQILHSMPKTMFHVPGICLGHAARNRIRERHAYADLAELNSTSLNLDTPHPVVALVTEWHRTRKKEVGTRRQRSRRHLARRKTGSLCQSRGTAS